MAPWWRRNHDWLTTIDIDLESCLLLSSWGCDMTKRLFLFALNWSWDCLLHYGLLLMLLGTDTAWVHQDGLLVDLHGWGRCTEDELVMAEDGTGSSRLSPIRCLLPILRRIRSWCGRRFKKLITAQVQTLLTSMANLVSSRSLVDRGSLGRHIGRWTLQPLLLLLVDTMGTSCSSSPNQFHFLSRMQHFLVSHWCSLGLIISNLRMSKEGQIKKCKMYVKTYLWIIYLSRMTSWHGRPGNEIKITARLLLSTCGVGGRAVVTRNLHLHILTSATLPPRLLLRLLLRRTSSDRGVIVHSFKIWFDFCFQMITLNLVWSQFKRLNLIINSRLIRVA